MKKTVTGHVIVKNEDRFIWFALMSTMDFCDRMIIYDTGSTDGTVNIIQNIINSKEDYRNKIIFEEKGVVDRITFAKLRQEQIERTRTDYFFVVDGDEIWWKNGLDELRLIIESEDDVMLVATKFFNCARDIYHYRNEYRDQYPIEKLNCAVTIRLYSMNIPGIHCGGYYGIEGYFDKDNKEVQNNVYKTVIQNEKYFHTSFIQRSSRTINDLKVFSRFFKLFPAYDYKFADDFRFPEVFYLEYPKCVKSPFVHQITVRSFLYFILDTCKVRKIINMFRRDKYE